MFVIVLGLIVNSGYSSDLAFGDKPDKEAAKEAREAAKQERNEAKQDAKDAREAAKQERNEAKQDAKDARENLKEFNDTVVVTSSSTTSSEKVTICHIPPGNPANAHTITVGSPAVTAHKAHGDYVDGSCEDDGFNPDEYESKKELRLSDDSNKESKALERAQKLIEKLEGQIANLEKRLQKLIEKYESGEYYGNISSVDEVTNSHVISFNGIGTSIYDDSIITQMSGELFMENQVTTSDSSKFKISSGEVKVGDAYYDVAFGKARMSSSGAGGDKTSLVIVLQVSDSDENNNTIKMTLGFDSELEGEFGSPAEEFQILDNSKVSGQWILDGNGKLSLET